MNVSWKRKPPRAQHVRLSDSGAQPRQPCTPEDAASQQQCTPEGAASWQQPQQPAAGGVQQPRHAAIDCVDERPRTASALTNMREPECRLVLPAVLLIVHAAAVVGMLQWFSGHQDLAPQSSRNPLNITQWSHFDVTLTNYTMHQTCDRCCLNGGVTRGHNLPTGSGSPAWERSIRYVIHTQPSLVHVDSGEKCTKPKLAASCAPTPCSIPGGVWCLNKTAARAAAGRDDDDDDTELEFESLFDDDDDQFMNVLFARADNTCERKLLWRHPHEEAADVRTEALSDVFYGPLLMIPAALTDLYLLARRAGLRLSGICSERAMLRRVHTACKLDRVNFPGYNFF
eukprot:2628185-Prymnesium_polylepis.1